MKNLFRTLSLVSIFAFLGFGAQPAYALFSPIGVSIFAPVQLPSEDFLITGVRLNLLLGQHHSVYGLDAGLVNITNNNFAGIQAGAVNVNKGEALAIGGQFGAIGNFNGSKANIYGVQAGLYNSNKAESMILGLSVGAVNNDPFTKIIGVQAGLYNKANHVYGIQVGIVNSAEYLHGIQIGLLNFNVHGLFAVAPILNVGF